MEGALGSEGMDRPEWAKGIKGIEAEKGLMGERRGARGVTRVEG
ncbi:hypothetical protein GCM10010361_52240 [Streptomyces olivaceiscleroticus]|uniref:Transposase n=1 Tax=Streptomyces olivaceiscleroticus TaxID=68245 RepID=A0ABN1AP68_9ACTN